jgi:5-(carboxyamino)imidazole ribonucleotide mutase
MNKSKPLVAIIMGSNSDWPIMEKGAKILEDFDITYEKK